MDSVSLPHGGFLEVVFSFDTSSLASCLGKLRTSVQDMIQRLQMDIPSIKLTFFVHGDFCDAYKHTAEWIDFTCEVAHLCNFIHNIKPTSGDNLPKHYELALKKVCDNLPWTAGSRRVLVMIGDSYPREPEESYNREWIDWRLEVKKLAQKGITIYGVQCGHVPKAKTFYRAISLVTGGKHLRLKNADSLLDTVMAVCYRESNDTAKMANYEKEVRARCIGSHLAADIDAIFENLRNDYVGSSSSLSLALAKLLLLFLKQTNVPEF